MKVCHVRDENLSCIYLLFIQRNLSKSKEKNFQQYHREFSIPLSITFIKIQHLLGPEKEGIFTTKTLPCRAAFKRSYATSKRTIAFQLLSLCFLLVPMVHKLTTKFLWHNFIAFIVMTINPFTSSLKIIETNCRSGFVV